MSGWRWVGGLLGLLLVFLAVPGLTHAHNAYALSLRLHQTPTGRFLEVLSPTQGFQAAFERRFADAVPLDSVEGKQRIVQYVKDTVLLTAPGGPLTLGKGILRVDGHQVFLRLSVAGPEGDLFPLAVHAPCLAENPGEIITFRFHSEARSARVLLTEAGDFEATLTLGPGGQIEVTKPTPQKGDGASPAPGPAPKPVAGEAK